MNSLAKYKEEENQRVANDDERLLNLNGTQVIKIKDGLGNIETDVLFVQ